MALAPVLRGDVDGRYPGHGWILVPGSHCDEACDTTVHLRDKHVGAGIRDGAPPQADAMLRLKRVESSLVDQALICCLPRRDLNLGKDRDVIRRRWAGLEAHAAPDLGVWPDSPRLQLVEQLPKEHLGALEVRGKLALRDSWR